MSMKKLFVANFPKFVEDEDLKQLFEQYGPVYDVTVWKDFDTGESKGWGTVVMHYERDADNATDDLDGSWWHHRKLTVNEFRPRR
jgi:RNA recognition motif-containing protein